MAPQSGALPDPTSAGRVCSPNTSTGSSRSSSTQCDPLVTPVSSHPPCLRGEDGPRATSDFDLLDFAQEAGTIPDTKHDERREAAIEAFCKVINASREDGAEVGLAEKPSDVSVRFRTMQTKSSVKLVLILVGSFAMNLHFPTSDIDCIVVGNISSATFWTMLREKILRYELNANNSHEQYSVILSRIISDVFVRTMILRVGEFTLNVQYCTAPIIAENWSNFKNPMNYNSLSPGPSSRVLDVYHDQIRFRKFTPSIKSFQLAYRLIKLFCIRRGIYSPRMGFLGGAHLAIMLRRIAEKLSNSASVFEYIKRFFQVYSAFPWASEIVSLADVTYKRSVSEPMVILSPQRPINNVAANATIFARQTIARELCLAYKSLLDGTSFAGVCGSEASSVANFLDNFKDFVRIDVNYWGGNCTTARALLAFVESRLTQLLVNLHTADRQAIVRLWPERLTNLSQAITDGGSSSVQGFYLLGLQLHQGKKSTNPMIGMLQAFENYVRTSASYFDVSTCFFGLSPCTRADIMKCGNIGYDRPQWRDDGIDEPVNPAEGEEAGTGAASYWEEVEDDRDRQESVVNQSVSKKQRRAAGVVQAGGHVPAERLRTSADVYNRLLWDPRYDEADHLIGYEDRFLGIKEIPLNSWSRDIDDETFVRTFPPYLDRLSDTAQLPVADSVSPNSAFPVQNDRRGHMGQTNEN